MKKILATILAFIYLSTSMGATVHLHYCMGKLMSWGLASHETRNCSYCGMPKNSSICEITGKGCCSDEHKHIQTERDQKASEFAFESLKYFSAVYIAYMGIEANYDYSTAIEYPTTNSPPFSKKVPVFILNCIYRI